MRLCVFRRNVLNKTVHFRRICGIRQISKSFNRFYLCIFPKFLKWNCAHLPVMQNETEFVHLVLYSMWNETVRRFTEYTKSTLNLKISEVNTKIKYILGSISAVQVGSFCQLHNHTKMSCKCTLKV